MQNETTRPLVQVAKTAAQYGLVVGALLAIFGGGSKPVFEWIGMVLGGAVWAVVLTVPVVWIKRKLFKPYITAKSAGNFETETNVPAMTTVPLQNAPPAPNRSETHDLSSQTPVAPIARDHPAAGPHESRVVASSQTLADEERFYAEIAKELETSVVDKGLWTRLFAECGGDEKQTKVQYIKQRVERLIAAERTRLELAARESALASTRAEIDRLTSMFVSGDKLSSDDVTRLAYASSSQSSIAVLSDRIRGETLLHWCARLNLKEEAATLVANGANPDAPNGNGRRPFELKDELAPRDVIHSTTETVPIGANPRTPTASQTEDGLGIAFFQALLRLIALIGLPILVLVLYWLLH